MSFFTSIINLFKIHWKLAIVYISSIYLTSVLLNLSTLEHEQHYHGSDERIPDIAKAFFMQGELITTILNVTWPLLQVWGLAVLVALVYRTEYVEFAHLLFVQMTFQFLCNFAPLMTYLPNPRPCMFSDPLYRTYGDWIWTKTDLKACGDMIWSGHTQNTMLNLWFSMGILQRCSASQPVSVLVVILLIVMTLLCVVPVLIGGAHYTVDIYLGAIIGVLAVSNHIVKNLSAKLFPVPPEYLPSDPPYVTAPLNDGDAA